jgi:hypothetical protein
MGENVNENESTKNQERQTSIKETLTDNSKSLIQAGKNILIYGTIVGAASAYFLRRRGYQMKNHFIYSYFFFTGYYFDHFIEYVRKHFNK